MWLFLFYVFVFVYLCCGVFWGVLCVIVVVLI